MSDFDNRNTGIISKNERKTEDKHPDYTGTIDVNGVEHWIDGYVRKRKDGSGTFLSLRIKLKQQRQDSRPKQTARSLPDDDGPPF